MINTYYRSEKDPLWEQYRDQSKTKTQREFFDKAREYCLQMYSCNLTLFIRTQCIYHPYDTDDYWMEVSESENPEAVIDDIFYKWQQWRQQAAINGSLLI
jgi:hypothetical protein